MSAPASFRIPNLAPGAEVVEDATAGQQANLVMADHMMSLGLVAAGLAHEVNNPLAALIGNLELAEQDLAKVQAIRATLPLAVAALTTDALAMLHDARDAAERVRQIVRDLKLFSRPHVECRNPLDLREVIEAALRMSWHEIRNRAHLVKDYGMMPSLYGNEARLGQVFLNLIVNAAQSISPGNVRDNEVRIVTGTTRDGLAVAEVRDTGAGIAPSMLDRVFDPFFTTKPPGVGTGLGLPLCRRIITEHGGRIEVESQIGKGTVFRVLLPSHDGGPASLRGV